jgi:hypothetical protein
MVGNDKPREFFLVPAYELIHVGFTRNNKVAHERWNEVPLLFWTRPIRRPFWLGRNLWPIMLRPLKTWGPFWLATLLSRVQHAFKILVMV